MLIALFAGCMTVHQPPVLEPASSPLPPAYTIAPDRRSVVACGPGHSVGELLDGLRPNPEDVLVEVTVQHRYVMSQLLFGLVLENCLTVTARVASPIVGEYDTFCSKHQDHCEQRPDGTWVPKR
jgi:hypothetical protein